MDQLLTGQFWHDQWAFVWSAPWVIIPLLLIAGLVGAKIKGALDGGEIRGLRAENSLADRQLKLAQHDQQVVTTQVELLKPSSGQLATEVAELKTEVARIKAELPDLVKAVLPQIDKVASTSAVVANTVSVLSEANSALGATLNKIYADASKPATLRYAGRSVDCYTLQEAVLEWMRLAETDRKQATIRADDGTVYNASEIDRLHWSLTRPDDKMMMRPGPPLVLSEDAKGSNIPNLRPSEVDDLKSELRRQQRSLDEFDVSATPQRLDDQTGQISANRGTVTIKLRKTGVERTYETGHASTWVVQFASDLDAGAFN